MKHLDHGVTKSRWEIPFQLVLLIVVFLFYSFDRRHPQIEQHQIVFFLSYVVAAMLINYLLMPKFFYNKKYWQFILTFSLTIVAVILVEELILEKIYFPDTRGTRFPGVFFSLLGVLPVITILSGFKFAWDLIRKQQEVEELKASMEESELKFLKSQINPHFLFNNLNNLYSYALENSPKTPEIILEMSAVLRYMLYECKEKYVPLSNELKQLGNFVRLNEMQVEERGNVEFSAPEPIDQSHRIAPLILMVFVENAFKHSTSSQADNIFIKIDIVLSDNGMLEFRCENSYKENSNDDSLSKGIGLQNAKKRLDLIYPQAHKLSIEELPDRYVVNLSLDLTSNDDDLYNH